MKQAFVKKGIVLPVEVPAPTVKYGYIKIRVLYSTVSAGTEITSLKGSGKSLLKRALEDPSKILRVVDILKTQGIKNATSKVSIAADGLNSIGYSVAGIVEEIGEGVDGFSIGDLVSAGGSGFAVHAEFVVVPKNLVVKVPEGLDMNWASTGTVGSISLHGVRRADLRIGEFAVVVGTGLLGLIATQILKASGVRVACVDINDGRLNLAAELGADIIINSLNEDPVQAIKNWTNGNGADAVLFFASTDKNEPLSQSFQMCRRKGKVVMIGVSGMLVDRNDIYRNEIDFIISTSYGPGRYDDSYELKGIDYPYAYVRWTENRNIYEYLLLVKEGKINLEKLIPSIYSIDDVEDAYKSLQINPEKHILTILKYNEEKLIAKSSLIEVNKSWRVESEKIRIGLIGAGSFAVGTLLPIIYENSDKYQLKTVVNSTGDKAINVARQFNAALASSNQEDIFNDPEIDLVMICTRHGNHAELVLKSLKANKHVFVEKPLATTESQLKEISDFYENDKPANKPIVMVGFNRRFSPHAQLIKNELDKRNSPVLLNYRMNAGFVPEDSWVHNDGGRIVGEACHIIDLMQYLTGSEVIEVSVNSLKPSKGKFLNSDNRSITYNFKDGSVGVLNYFALGNSNLPKETLEVHFDNKTMILNDYKSIESYGLKIKSQEFTTSRKGHREEWITLHDSLKKGLWPIPLQSLLHTTHLSLLSSKQY
jgi:predicted dehydrogenase/threonine dehydrogenase-like Zn-dependent dehydrogenase